MIQRLFDKIEETPQEKREEEKPTENKIEEVILSDDESPLEIPDLNDPEIIELPASFETVKSRAEVSAFPDAEIFEKAEIQPEITVFHEPQSVTEQATQFHFSDLPEHQAPTEINEKIKDEPMLFKMPFEPESTAETVRKSGLAWAAAIALFGSVVFCLIIGWFADLLLGTSPWGIVGGIVLGSIVGFFQFFRMTSQILKNKE